MSPQQIVFAVDGEIEEGAFGIVGLADGTVIYDTPVGRFTRFPGFDGELKPAQPRKRGLAAHSQPNPASLATEREDA